MILNIIIAIFLFPPPHIYTEPTTCVHGLYVSPPSLEVSVLFGWRLVCYMVGGVENALG